MTRQPRILIFVGLVTTAAILVGVALWPGRLPFPGWWPLLTFVLVATLLDNLNTQLRVTARGSTSFIMHMATALLFGGWWGAVVAGSSTLLGEFGRGSPGVKLIFNISQRILAVPLAALAYHLVGGQLPPNYLETS